MSALTRLFVSLVFLLSLWQLVVDIETGIDLEETYGLSRHGRDLPFWQRWFKRRNRRQSSNTPSPLVTPPPLVTPSPLVGAYYYPWYLDDFHQNYGFLREQLDPPQLPVLGKYNDRNVHTYHMHLKWCMDHNIFLWVMSWFGPNSRTDVTSKLIRDYAMKQTHSDDFPIKNFRFAHHYETIGLITEIGTSGKYDTSTVKNDIFEMATSYFSHPNQLKIQGKPVVVLYLSHRLEGRKSHPGLLNEVIGLMRQGAADAGFSDIYIIGDYTYFDSSQGTVNAFTLLDAVTNYDVFGTMGQPLYAGKATVQAYYDMQQQWKDKAKAQGCAFIPSATPGFNNKGLTTQFPFTPMSRKLTPDAEEGSLLREMLIRAKAQVDSDASNIMLITSFNEWMEDTQIEPCITMAAATQARAISMPRNLTDHLDYEAYKTLYSEIDIAMTDDATQPRTTRVPNYLTYDIEYEAYGTLYLEIVKEVTR